MTKRSLMAAEVHHHVCISKAARALVLAGLLAASCAMPAVPASPAATSPTAATAPAAPAASAPNRVAPDIANRALAARVHDSARTDVAICLYVDPSTGLNADAARILLQDSVDALVRQGYTALGARSVTACPQVPLFLRTNTVHPKNSGSGPVAPAPIVTTPSPFLLFVAVTTPARIATIFGGSTIRRGTEEAACPGGGDNCLEVTSSIYTDPATFADAALRQTLVLDGLGLLGAK